MIARMLRMHRTLHMLAWLALAHIANAQCPNNNTLSGSAVSVTCPGGISGGCILGGRYALVNVVSGNIYTFSTCDATWNTYITLYNNGSGAQLGFNNDACNGNRSTVQWTASFTGQVRVLVDNGSCNSGSNPCAPLWITCSLNDDRCTATPLGVGSTCVNTIGTNVGASPSGDAAASCGSYSGGDVWYSFVAPASGNIQLTASTVGGSSLTDGAMAVYSAASCSAASTQLACNDNSPYGGNMPYIYLTGLTNGTTYYVRFWEDGNDAFGAFNICAANPLATNDDPCAATSLTVGTSCTNTLGNNFGATNSTGVPAPSCGNYAGGDVWFSFVAPANGQATVTTSASSGPVTDAAMAVYSTTACSGTFTEIACNDDPISGGLMPMVTLNALTPGATYYVRLWEYGNNSFGPFNICVTTPTAPSNDNPCSATTLAVGSSCTNTTATTSGSTSTSGPPAPTCGNYLGNDVWFTAIAPASGRLAVVTSTVGGSAVTDAAMAVYTAGSCGAAMTQVACTDNVPGNNMPTQTFSGLTSGATYYIRVWVAGNTSNGQFNICAFEPVANDDPCGATALTVGSSCSMTSYSNASGSLTTGLAAAPCGSMTGSSRDVWFSFAAPASGIAILESTAGTLTDGSMALYYGNSCAPAGLSLVECDADDGPGNMPYLRFSNLVPGGSYYVRYWGAGSNTGTFNLCVWSPTVPAGFNCYYFLELFDSGGNGWGSSSVSVSRNGGAATNYTVASGSYANAIIGLNIGDVLQVSYSSSGPNQDENVYEIRQVPGGVGVLQQGPSPANGIALLEAVDCVPPDPPNEDCRGASPVCGGQAFNDNPQGIGFDVDLQSYTYGCLSAAERQGTWYRFVMATGGTVGMTIVPTDANDDYDFAIWGPDNSVICPPYKQPSRCSWSGLLGNTGLSSSASDTTETDAGDKFVAPLATVTGSRYLLYISNYTQSGLAFDLTWQLTNGASLDCMLLPADFIELQAELDGEHVQVDWATPSEHDISHYIIQRSGDAFNYEPIGSLSAVGSSSGLLNYSFVDETPLEGLNYYRVEQVAMSGDSRLSPADHAIYRKAATDMVVFPNPAGEVLFASFDMPEDDAVIWRILDANGRLIEQDLYQGSKGNMLIDLPLERIAPGAYTVVVNDTHGRVNLNARFVKH